MSTGGYIISLKFEFSRQICSGWAVFCDTRCLESPREYHCRYSLIWKPGIAWRCTEAPLILLWAVIFICWHLHLGSAGSEMPVMTLPLLLLSSFIYEFPSSAGFQVENSSSNLLIRCSAFLTVLSMFSLTLRILKEDQAPDVCMFCWFKSQAWNQLFKIS